MFLVPQTEESCRRVVTVDLGAFPHSGVGDQRRSESGRLSATKLPPTWHAMIRTFCRTLAVSAGPLSDNGRANEILTFAVNTCCAAYWEPPQAAAASQAACRRIPTLLARMSQSCQPKPVRSVRARGQAVGGPPPTGRLTRAPGRPDEDDRASKPRNLATWRSPPHSLSYFRQPAFPHLQLTRCLVGPLALCSGRFASPGVQ